MKFKLTKIVKFAVEDKGTLLGVVRVYIKSKVMLPKNTTSAQVVQVVSGLTSPNLEPKGMVVIDGIKYHS